MRNDGTSEYVYAATVLQSRGPALGLLFRLPLLENVDVNFRLADYYAHTELTSTLIAAEHTSGTVTSNSSSLLAGIGLSYTFAGHWLAKLDYLRVNQAGNDKTMKYDIGMASAGVAYAFNRRTLNHGQSDGENRAAAVRSIDAAALPP